MTLLDESQDVSPHPAIGRELAYDPAEAAPQPPQELSGGPFRRGVKAFWRDVKSWSQLRHTPYGLLPALLIGALWFFQEFDSQAFYVTGPDFVRHGVNINGIILVTVQIGILGVIANILVGYWADRHNRVRLFAIGNFISGIGAFFTGRRFTAGSVGAARVTDEVGNNASQVPEFSIVSDFYPPEARGRSFALLGTLTGVAALLAPFATAGLVEWVGIKTTFEIVGVPILVLALACLVLLREPVRGYFERRQAGMDEGAAKVEDDPMSFGEAWRSVWAVRTLRRIVYAQIFISFVDGAFSFFFPFFLAERYGLSILGRALFGLPAVLVGVVGGVYGGGLADRLIRRNPGRVLVLYGVVQTFIVVSALGYSFEPPLIVLVIWLCIRHLPAGLIGPARQSVLSDVIPASIRTQGLQMTQLSVIPGFLFGFPMAAIIRSQYGYAAMFRFFIPFYVIGGLLLASAGVFFDYDKRNAVAASAAAEEWLRAKRSGAAKLLVCRNVDVEYQGVQVLFGVDFDVEEGEIVALLGTNGAGKSTLLRAISGSQEASAGAIVLSGRDITHMPPHEVAARGVVHMPGGRGIFPDLSVRDNLLMATWLSHDSDRLKADLAEVFEIFPVLEDRLDSPAGLLSGGQQQMLSLAQALLMKPAILMIDELSLGLSPAMVSQLLDVVREIHRRGVTIVIVEQSVNVALSIAKRAIFLEKGEVKFCGPTSELLSRPDILRAVYVKGTGALTEGPVSVQRATAQRRALDLGTARPVLEIDGLVKKFGGVTALNGVSLDLREGEVLGIIGPNGSGKTTLFDIVSGFVAPDEGTIRYEGADITSLSPEERARRRLIRRFQDAKLFPSLTVFETLLVALEQRHELRSTLLSAVAAPPARRAERRLRVRADRLIDLLELGAFRDKFVRELSTGLRRIVDLACVLAAEPRVLLLDEPSSGIAQAEAEGLGPLLRRVKFETSCSMLIIEHDMPLVSAVSDELVCLHQGDVLVRGSAEQVLNDERVIEAYLGGSEAAVQRSGALT